MGDGAAAAPTRAAATEAMGNVLLAVGPGAVPVAVWERALATAGAGLERPAGDEVHAHPAQ